MLSKASGMIPWSAPSKPHLHVRARATSMRRPRPAPPAAPPVFLLSSELKKLARTPSEVAAAPPGPPPTLLASTWKWQELHLIRYVAFKFKHCDLQAYSTYSDTL